MTYRIALVSDPHVTLAPKLGAYRDHFEAVLADVKAVGVDLVLIAGDLTDDGLPEQIHAFRKLAAGFNAPVRWVYGNHDVGAKVGIIGADGRPAPGAVTAARVARFREALGASFWAETFRGLRVLAVDTPVLGSGLPVEAAQWAFLERELPARGAADGPPTVLLTHYPPYLERPDEPGGGYWNVEPAPRARLLPLIERDRTVRAWLCGHLHRGLGLVHKGMLVCATPPVSYGIPETQAEGWTLVTLPDAGKAVTTEFRPVTKKGGAPPGR